MLIVFFLIPALCGAMCLFLQGAWLRLALIGGGSAHLALTLTGVFCPFPALTGWLALDSPARLFLLVLSLLFLLVSVYSRDYMMLNSRVARYESRYSCCLLLMLGSMSVVILSRHLGLTWLAMEGTVLLGWPLIYYHHTPGALESAWKYLIICSVGIALAFAGNLFLGFAFNGSGSPLLLDNLLQAGAIAEPKWLKAAYIFSLVGYGTIMGLAPMHTWLPDACSEAPSPVSALLPALMNCSYLVILRMGEVCGGAGLGAFRQDLLMFFGISSLIFAAIFIIGQKDYSRMLAYSSTSSAGWLMLGAGIGPMGMLGALLHMFSHSMIKGMLFMLCGNIIAVYRSRMVEKVGGLLQVIPSTGVLWLGGFMALAGLPPFGIFQSNIRICQGMVESGSYLVLGVGLLLSAAMFVGMLLVFVSMSFDVPPPGMSMKPGNPLLKNLLGPAALAGIMGLLPGIYIPGWLEQLLRESAALFGG
jgi:hydrogenase-4 component F